MRVLVLLGCLALAAFAGCGGGGDDDDGQAAAEPTATATAAPEPTATEPSETDATTTTPEPTADPVSLAERPPGEDGLRVPAERARIVAKASEFGRVLFDANGQVVYIFENDRRDRSNCTSADCVEAWPPVLTEGPPTAGAGVDAERLGTIRRADGSLQVTYAGLPLYFYEHEGPAEIRCHNVNLHGGLWWVVTPAGKAAA